MEELSIENLMERLPQAFIPEKAKGVAATVYFHLTGEGGGDWVVTIRDQTCQVSRGQALSSDLTLAASAQDCLDLFTDKLDGFSAYLQGRFQLSGSINLALKLVDLFDMKRGS